MRSGRIRAVLLDAGNTLVFPQFEVVIADLKEHGHAATPEDFYAAERLAKQKLDEWLWPMMRAGTVPEQIDYYYWTEYLREFTRRLGVPEEGRGELTRLLVADFQNIQLWSRVMPDTLAFLDWMLAQGYLLGVVSNSIGTLEGQLVGLGLARYFKAILDSAIVGIQKPHSGIFKLALQRLGVESSEAVFVGDTYATDIGGAQLAGITGVLIDTVDAYPGATCPRISSLPELRSVLESL
ncbi:MAG: HAD family hydrolase [Terriglobia bacterium]|jgi:putative hydrolase of the HAD superfamily